jgi:hypothetical protein
MFAPVNEHKALYALVGLTLLLVGLVCLTALGATPVVSAQESAPPAPAAACPGGPTIDGILLDECVNENFTVGGDNVGITVWYTKNPMTATRTVDGVTYVVEHWITTDAQAQNVATWGREAWEEFFGIFGRHPWNCSLHINVRLEDGIGWSGIARWTSGDCNIGIDAPMIRGNDPDDAQVVYHEFQHFMQRAYDDGCSAATRPGYPGNAEWVEGYADLGSDAVTAAVDSWMYGNVVASYNPLTSFYDKSYYDACNKYLMEQLGIQWNPADPQHHMDAVVAHYEECDNQDSLYVENTLVSSLSGGQWTWEELFLNFFAANWAHDWADAATQPELVYTDDDANPYGAIPVQQNVALAAGSQSWAAQTTPDDWAGRYYQVRPQAGCGYVTVEVDGDPGDRLGINLMAADTVAPTSVSRSAWIGEDFTRTFAGFGVHDRVVAAVNAFANNGGYDVSFTCVSPALELLEPRPLPNSTLVGDPASPIAFLARFRVSSGGTPVRGLPVTSFSADAEGDAVTLIADSFQEVGEEYWVTMIPPIKPAGTTFVDLEVCLDGAICDTNTDALLYVDPGHTDFALVFDASGSMDTEDVTGEGMRYENAQKAGYVLADLLRNDDRILVTDFSALNQPVSAGATCPPDCTLDLRTLLTRRDVVAGTIDQVKTAIGQTNARDWTPIGAALQDAKNQLQAAPYSLNPKVIVLLSDGEENVNPMYTDVRTELRDSGVIIDTVGFGIEGEVGEATLAQISADTGGTFRFVPSLPGARATVDAAAVEQLRQWGASEAFIADTINAWQPGPLGLDEVYDYFETKNQGASRLYHDNYLDAVLGEEETMQVTVDSSTNRLRFVVASQDASYPYGCGTLYRSADVLPPGADPVYGWIPISPWPETPSGWVVHNGTYDDVAMIPNPAAGTWRVRAEFNLRGPCAEAEAPSEPATPDAAGYDFMMSSSAQSEYHLEGRFLAPLVENQGQMGDAVPIVGTLLSRAGTVPGAFFWTVPDVLFVTIEKPGTQAYMLLYDDGAHEDGEAQDGIYGGTYSATDVGGTYNVLILATFRDPNNSSRVLSREWRGSFWIHGLEGNDGDQDTMPDGWEEDHGLDTTIDDSLGDCDGDGLKNIDELHRGTEPCDADTDDGGEQDGSEVAGSRNPLYAPDDQVDQLGHITAEGQNGSIDIQWPQPGECDNLRVYVSTSPDELGTPIDLGSSGDESLLGLNNGTTYYLTFVCLDDCSAPYDDCNIGDSTGPIEVTPSADPDPPSGAILIDDGAPEAKSRRVTLSLSATDTPLEGPASPSTGAVQGPHTDLNAVSGIAEMVLSNDGVFDDETWEPFAVEKLWMLEYTGPGDYFVFAKFRDGAGNESLVVHDDIYVDIKIGYLPLIMKE